MFFQIKIGIELQFIAYLIPVIIGIQLAFYFIYQYHKIKDVNLPLNRVLLAFGSFIFFMILGPLFIQISRNFIEYGILNEIFSRIGWFLAFFSTISISLFIIRKDFSIIINLQIAKILMVLNFIPAVIVFFVPTMRSPIFIISIIFVILNGLYILRFQVILIKTSIGIIKRKFKLFFIGAIVSLFALIFAALVGLGVLPHIINEIIYFIGVGELLIGFIIISLSVHNFPPFYEFEWRENIIKLLIINQQTKSCLYSYNFIEKLEKKIVTNKNHLGNYDKVFSKGILGIDTIIATITGTKDQRINKIRQGDFHIFLEDGSNPSDITYVLIVKKDLISSYHLLKSIRIRFESFFKEILSNLNDLKEEHFQLFESFDINLNQILQ